MVRIDGPNRTRSQVSCPDTKGLGLSRLFRSDISCRTCGEVATRHVNILKVFMNARSNTVLDRFFLRFVNLSIKASTFCFNTIQYTHGWPSLASIHALYSLCNGWNTNHFQFLCSFRLLTLLEHKPTLKNDSIELHRSDLDVFDRLAGCSGEKWKAALKAFAAQGKNKAAQEAEAND